MTLIDRLRTHGLMPVATRVAAEQAVAVHALPNHATALRALGRALVERGWSSWSAGNLLGLPLGWDAPPGMPPAPPPAQAPQQPAPVAAARVVTPPKQSEPLAPPPSAPAAPSPPSPPPPAPTLPRPRRVRAENVVQAPLDVPQKRRGVPRSERLAAQRARRNDAPEDLDLAAEVLANDVEDAPASPWDPDDDAEEATEAPLVNDQAHRLRVTAKIREDRERARLRNGFYDRARAEDDRAEDDLDEDGEAPDAAGTDETAPPEEPGEPEEPNDLEESHVPHERRRATDVISRADLDLGRILYPEEDHGRPRTRGECVEGPRPCPYVSCQHHLYLDVVGKRIVLNFPLIGPEEMTHSCALDIADRGGATLEIVARMSNVTRERIRQIESKTIRKIQNDKHRLRLLKGDDP